MAKKSAGILLYRIRNNTLEVLLVHPGGPFWQYKDAGAWSIPKGEYTDEAPLTAALREFQEETGILLHAEGNIPLTPIMQKSGKQVTAFAIPGDIAPENIRSNHFELGNKSYPEIDKAEWFPIPAATKKINPAQAALLQELAHILLDNPKN